MSRIKFIHTYYDIISIENLLLAWKEFRKGKRSRKDIQEFERDLMCNVISLHTDLANKVYAHSPYEAFKIHDPKSRYIHKATVGDRLLHHAIYRILYPFFDRTFISDSTSCRLGKGTHGAINRFMVFSSKITLNYTRTAWVLKCDIRKFFASIDQKALISILETYILDKQIIALISEIVSSFSSKEKGIGLPLGNLTSQLLANVYMNEFDQFLKHKLKMKYYIRYADDFVIFSSDRTQLHLTILSINNFLKGRLMLQLHPKKISIRTISSGNDYLGWINFPNHRVLRTSAKRRMFRRLHYCDGKPATVQSYLGLISHGNSKKLKNKIESSYPAKTQTSSHWSHFRKMIPLCWCINILLGVDYIKRKSKTTNCWWFLI